MSRSLKLALLFLVAATSASAADVDLTLGIRGFGPDGERWPELGCGLRFGSDAWRFRPEVGVALASDALYGGEIVEGRVGLGGDLPHSGRSVLSWGLGYARVRYQLGANEGEADAGFLQLAWRWERPEDVDFGVALRYLDGDDIALHSAHDPSGAPGVFHESISTVAASFLLHW